MISRCEAIPSCALICLFSSNRFWSLVFGCCCIKSNCALPLLISLYHAIRLRLHKVKLFLYYVYMHVYALNLFIHSSQCLKDVVFNLICISGLFELCAPWLVAAKYACPLILLAFTLGLNVPCCLYCLPLLIFVLINFEMLKKTDTHIVAALVFTVATFTFFICMIFKYVILIYWIAYMVVANSYWVAGVSAPNIHNPADWTNVVLSLVLSSLILTSRRFVLE